MQNRVFRVHVCWAHGTIVCRTTKPAGGQTGPRSLNLTYKSALRISPPRRAALLQHPLRKWFSGSPAGPGNAISPRGTRKKRGPISKSFLLRSDNPVCRAVAPFATRDFAEWFAQPFPTPWWGGRRPPPPGGGRVSCFGHVINTLSSRALASGSGLSPFLSGLGNRGAFAGAPYEERRPAVLLGGQ